MSQANVDLMTRAIKALQARNFDIDELFADSVEWRPVLTAGGGVEGTVYRGKAGMRDYIRDFDNGFDEMALDVTEIESVGEDRVLYRGRLSGRGKASGVQLDVPMWGLWEVEDGRLIRGEGFLDEDEALRAAGLEEQPCRQIHGRYWAFPRLCAARSAAADSPSLPTLTLDLGTSDDPSCLSWAAGRLPPPCATID